MLELNAVADLIEKKKKREREKNILFLRKQVLALAQEELAQAFGDKTNTYPGAGRQLQTTMDKASTATYPV